MALNPLQVTVGTVATEIIPFNSERNSLVIKVPSAATNSVYLVENINATIAEGHIHILDAGDSYVTAAKDAFFGVATAATAITFMEES